MGTARSGRVMPRPTTIKRELSSEDIYEEYDRVFTDPKGFLETKSTVQIAKDSAQAAAGPNASRSVLPDIDYFLEDDGDNLLPSYLTDAIRNLCLSSTLSTGRYQPIHASDGAENRKAWIDDRASQSHDKKTFRCHQNPVAAKALREALQRKRWNEETEPDADRRLIHIEDLDGDYISVLAGTALPHQVAALREALASYIDFSTVFKLSTNRPRKSIFRISMHMTFPVRLLPDREELAPPGLWPDSFLNTNQAEHRSGSLPPRLYTARKTIELCACGYRKYTVWSFADRLHGVDSIREKDSSDFSYNTYNIENNPNVHEDQIAFGRAMDANIPIMDAREYILVQFSINIEKVLEYWSDTVKSHKKPFEDHEQSIRSLPPANQVLSRQRHWDFIEEYEQTQWWGNRLGKLKNDLSQLISGLDDFLGPDGGIDFISRCSSSDALKIDTRLRSIRNSFHDLKSIHRTLSGWSERSARDSETLEKRLTIEANNRNVEMASINRVTMQYIPPIMVIVGLCSMNEKFIPFTLSKIGLLVATVVVALAYALLQYVVSQYHENPKWWTDFPARLYERFGEVGLDIGRIFRGLRVTRSGTPDDLQASSESA